MTTKRNLTHRKNLLAMIKNDIDEKTIKDDIQTNVNKNNCNEETATNLFIYLFIY